MGARRNVAADEKTLRSPLTTAPDLALTGDKAPNSAPTPLAGFYTTWVESGPSIKPVAGQRQCRPFQVAMSDLDNGHSNKVDRCHGKVRDGPIPYPWPGQPQIRTDSSQPRAAEQDWQIGLRSGLLEQVLATRTVGAWTRH